jgi:hypothetical protein
MEKDWCMWTFARASLTASRRSSDRAAPNVRPRGKFHLPIRHSNEEPQDTLENLLKEAPNLYPLRTLIKGVVCGVRVENIEEPTMREIRYPDKLFDELAKGTAMDKFLRT